MRWCTLLLAFGCMLLSAAVSHGQEGNDFPLFVHDVWSDGTCDYATLHFTCTFQTAPCLDADETAMIIVQFNPSGPYPFFYQEYYNGWLGYTPGSYDFSINFWYSPYEPALLSGELLVTVVKTDGVGGPNCSASVSSNQSGIGMQDAPLNNHFELFWQGETAACPGEANGAVTYFPTSPVSGPDPNLFNITATVIPEVETAMWEGAFSEDGQWHYTLSGLPAGIYELQLSLPPNASGAGSEWFPCGLESSHFVIINEVPEQTSTEVLLTQLEGICQSSLGTASFAWRAVTETGQDWLNWEEWSLSPAVPEATVNFYTQVLDGVEQPILEITGLPIGAYTLSALPGDATAENATFNCLNGASLDFAIVEQEGHPSEIVLTAVEGACWDTPGTASFAWRAVTETGQDWLNWEEWSLSPSVPEATVNFYTQDLDGVEQPILEITGLPLGEYTLSTIPGTATAEGSTFDCLTGTSFDFTLPELQGQPTEVVLTEVEGACWELPGTARFAWRAITESGQDWLAWQEWSLWPSVPEATVNFSVEEVEGAEAYILEIAGLPTGDYFLAAVVDQTSPGDQPFPCLTNSNLNFSIPEAEQQPAATVLLANDQDCNGQSTVALGLNLSADGDAWVEWDQWSFTPLPEGASATLLPLNSTYDGDHVLKISPLPEGTYTLTAYSAQSEAGLVCLSPSEFSIEVAALDPEEALTVMSASGSPCNNAAAASLSLQIPGGFDFPADSVQLIGLEPEPVWWPTVPVEGNLYQLQGLPDNASFEVLVENEEGCAQTTTATTPDAIVDVSLLQSTLLAPAPNAITAGQILIEAVEENLEWSVHYEGNDYTLPAVLNALPGDWNYALHATPCTTSFSFTIPMINEADDIPQLTNAEVSAFGRQVALSDDGLEMAVLSGESDAVVELYALQSDSWALQNAIDIPQMPAAHTRIAFSGDGQTLALSNTQTCGQEGSTCSGGVWTYRKLPTGWEPMGAALFDLSDWSFEFGNDIALSQDGSILAVGYPKSNSGVFSLNGEVRIYAFEDDWTLLGSPISGAYNNQCIGHAVDLSNDGLRVATSSIEHTFPDSNEGISQVYEFTAGDWVQVGGDVVGNTNDELGSSVAISGDGTTLVTGAPNWNYYANGAVYVWELQAEEWVQRGEPITPPVTDVAVHLGHDVDISADGRTVVMCNKRYGAGLPFFPTDARRCDWICGQWVTSHQWEYAVSAANMFPSVAVDAAGLNAVHGNHAIGTVLHNNILINEPAPTPLVDELPLITVPCGGLPTPAQGETYCDDIVTGIPLVPVQTDVLGPTEITWLYAGADYTTAQTQTIEVIDQDAPVADVATLEDQVDNCSIASPTATDLCEGVIVGTTEDPLYYDTPGTYTVTWTYQDSSGNASFQTQLIVVSSPCALAGECPGDVSGDGTISATDMLMVLGEFGCTALCTMDLDGDGVVSASDLLVVLGGFGDACEYE